MGMFRPDRSYLICTVQRTGSELLCTLLHDTGIAGLPPRHELCQACWQKEWTPEEFSANIACALRGATGGNGLCGTRMFWNAWGLFLERAKLAFSEMDADDLEVLKAVFHELQFVWLRRQNKLRQAISFWRATTGGDQFRYPTDGTPVNVPEFDFDRISLFIHHVSEQEDNWKDWFDNHEITPMQVTCEDLLTDRERVIREVLEFLKLDCPADLPMPKPRVRQQADEHTERYIRLYEEERNRRCKLPANHKIS